MAAFGVDNLTISSIPWMYISEWTQDKRLAGRTGGFFDAVAASMNLSYSVKVPPDFQWGSCLANGTACAGMLGDVFYERADVAIGPFSASPVYSALFEPSTPVLYEEYTVLVGTQVAYAVNTFSTFTGIEGIVYGLLLLLPLAVALLVAANSRWILPKIDQADGSRVFTLFLDLLRLNAQTASNIQVKSASNRLLVTGSMIASVFTAIMISSSIKATMMRRDPTERIRTVQDLLRKQHRMKPFVVPNTFITDVIAASDTKEMKDLWHWLERDGFIGIDKFITPETVRGLLNGTMFTLSNCDLAAVFFAAQYYMLPDKYRGYLSCLEQNILGTPLMWYYRRTLPEEFIREFNRRTRWLFEAPSRFVFQFKYTAVPPDRFAKSTSLSGDAVMDALRVDEVIGCFYVLGSGAAAAFALLLLEILRAVLEPAKAVLTKLTDPNAV